MTLLEVNDQMDYFKQHPPLHLMVAAYLGVETKAGAAQAPQAPRTTEEELRALWATNGGI